MQLLWLRERLYRETSALLEVIMRLCILVVMSCLAVALTQAHPALPPGPIPAEQMHGSMADELVGAWRLVSVETKRPNGEVIYPFYGRHPEGSLIYDRSGYMSVQIVSDPEAERASRQLSRGLSGGPTDRKGERRRWLLRLFRDLDR